MVLTPFDELIDVERVTVQRRQANCDRSDRRHRDRVWRDPELVDERRRLAHAVSWGEVEAEIDNHGASANVAECRLDLRRQIALHFDKVLLASAHRT